MRHQRSSSRGDYGGRVRQYEDDGSSWDGTPNRRVLGLRSLSDGVSDAPLPLPVALQAPVRDGTASYTFRFKQSKFCCATKAQSDPLSGVRAKDVSAAASAFFGRTPDKVLVSRELHASGLTHLHFYMHFDKLVCKTGIFRINDQPVTEVRRKKGAMVMADVIRYIIKEGDHDNLGMGDINHLLMTYRRKVGHSQEALLVKDIKDGKTDDELYKTHSVAMFRSGHKVPEFRRKYESSAFEKKELKLLEHQEWFNDNASELLDWYLLLRRGRLPKEFYHLWLYGEQKSWGKTTFLKLLQTVCNVPGDPGYNVQDHWQDSLSDKNLILACDSISSPCLPFRIVEVLATSKYEFPKRHGGGIFWQGPMVCTSNKDYNDLGYIDKARMPMDMGVWDARFLQVKLTEPLHKFNAWFAREQGLQLEGYQIISEDSPVRRMRARKRQRLEHPVVEF